MESVTVNKCRDKIKPGDPDQLCKPSSPPTVVDLVPAGKPVDGEHPVPELIKEEPSSDTEKPVAATESGRESKERELEEKFENDVDDEFVASDDENVSRLGIYSSAVTLPQSCADLRQKRRRLRRKKQQLRELNAAKRLKRSSEAVATAEDVQLEDEDTKPDLRPLPRAYLQRLALILGQKLKVEEDDNTEVSENVAPELLEMNDPEQLQPPRANHQQHHRSNHNNNNNTVLNNNNSSSSNVMNKDVSISEKINVIKQEAEELVGGKCEDQPVASTSAAAAAARAAEAAAAAEAASSTTTLAAPNPGPSLEEVAKTIKREMIDADDSNEPLSSIRTAAVMLSTQTSVSELMDDEAEDDVNLAQLSSIIRHTAVKKELEAQQHQQQVQHEQMQAARKMEEDEAAPCLNQLPDVIRLRNIRNSQVHARPKDLFVQAPVDEEFNADYMGGLSPTSSQRLDICNELLSEIRRDWLHFRPKTPTDELSDSQDCEVGKTCDSHAVDWTQDTPISVELNRLGKREAEESDSSSYFLSSGFKYRDLESDAQLLQTVQAQDYARGSSKSPNCSGSGSGSALEFNLSGGDSLNDINNLLGCDDEDDNHEHMLDNILQECAMDDPKALNQATNFWNGILDGEAAVDEVEMADQLLDCIDEKKSKVGAADTSKRAARNRKARLIQAPVGSSAFTVCPTAETLKERELFFSQAPPVEVPPKEKTPAEVELPEVVVKETANLPVKVEAVEKPQSEVLPVAPQPQQLQPQAITLPTTQLINIPAQISTQKQHQQPQVTQLLNQFANAGPQIIARTEYGGGAAVGDIVTITPHTGSSPLPTLTAQQQLQHQLAQAQLRNVTVQQRQATPQNPNQNQNPQQQLLFQMQRDPSRSLTPLQAAGAGATGNHLIYTTSCGEIVTAGAAASASQKVTYAIQKAGVSSGGATTASIGPNTVITLSNVKVQNDDISSGGSGNSGSSVNIINTASGQQLAVHSIAGMQQQGQQQVQQVTTSTPLLVATPTRNNVQQQQQQLVQQQPIVWRQVSGTNTAVATTAVLSTTVDSSPKAVTNQILWTSRATQKRQLNGPENTGKRWFPRIAI